jgi:hypothetical protein
VAEATSSAPRPQLDICARAGAVHSTPTSWNARGATNGPETPAGSSPIAWLNTAKGRADARAAIPAPGRNNDTAPAPATAPRAVRRVSLGSRSVAASVIDQPAKRTAIRRPAGKVIRWDPPILTLVFSADARFWLSLFDRTSGGVREPGSRC